MSLPIISAALIAALIQVESRGRDQITGDNGKAFGCLQIREEVLADVRRLTGINLRLQDMFDRKISVQVCAYYLGYWGDSERLGHVATNEDLARIWNGGPDGWRQTETWGYWLKVQAYIKVQISPNPEVPSFSALRDWHVNEMLKEENTRVVVLTSRGLGKVAFVREALNILEPGRVPTDGDPNSEHPVTKAPQGSEKSDQSKGTARGIH